MTEGGKGVSEEKGVRRMDVEVRELTASQRCYHHHSTRILE
jgi:hypothetical protein